VRTFLLRALVPAIWSTLLAVGAFLFCLSARGDEISSAAEHKLKAAFVYNFAKFVEWPASISTNTPLVIGVKGEAAMRTALEVAIGSRRINGRAIEVRTVNTVADAQAAQVLFVSATEDRHLSALLANIRLAPVLTVGESDAFARADGIINFVREENRYRFDINLDSAEQAGVKISAQLLKLARTVRRKS